MNAMTFNLARVDGCSDQAQDWAFCLVCGGPLLEGGKVQTKIHEAKNMIQASKHVGRRLEPLAWLKDFQCAGSMLGLPHTAHIVAADRQFTQATNRLVIIWDWGPGRHMSRQYTLHAACARILSRTFKSQSNRAIGSTRALYLALEAQYQLLAASSNQLKSPRTEVHDLPSMKWPHGFFGASRSQDGAWKNKESGPDVSFPSHISTTEARKNRSNVDRRSTYLTNYVCRKPNTRRTRKRFPALPSTYFPSSSHLKQRPPRHRKAPA